MEDEKDLTGIETTEIPVLSDKEADKKEQEKIDNIVAGGM